MSQTFGDFIEEFTQEHDSLELSFTCRSRSLKKNWRNNRLSAFFVADYCSNLLPIDEDETQAEEGITEIKNTVSYVGNELLENAIKFSEEIPPYTVKFGMHFMDALEEVTVIIFTKNSITIPSFEKFQSFIEELLSADPNELYVQQIEKTAEDENSEASGLGLLTMLNDYSAKLGWKFEPDPSNLQMIAVTTMAQVVV
jgi:hypothetical protein